MTCLKVSIITPSYNQGQFIEQTIDSVLSQHYQNLEYIIIDGGSKDNTIEIIKKYEKHLTYWVSEKDNGQSSAINKGFKYAKGDIFNWINSDDYYEKETFHSINELFQDPEINVVCGKSKIIYPNGESKLAKGSFINYHNLPKTIGIAQINQPATFFRTASIRNVFPLNELLHFLMDRELWIKYLLRYGLKGIANVNFPFVNFRIHENSKTGSQSNAFNNEREGIYLALMKKVELYELVNFIQQNFSYKRNYIFSYSFTKQNLEMLKDSISYYLLQLMDESYYNGNYKLANCLKTWIDLNKLNPKEKKYLSVLNFKNNIKRLLNGA